MLNDCLQKKCTVVCVTTDNVLISYLLFIGNVTTVKSVKTLENKNTCIIHILSYGPRSELKITVCHRSFSDPFWHMTDQMQFGRTHFTIHFQWGSH